jgi:DNA sulfur modification protein DndC
VRQGALFGEGARLQMTESIELTIASLLAHGPEHRHWAVAWSGGKDSTALVTLLAYLLDSDKVPRPERLTVLYADTRMELLPLWASAQAIRGELEERGIDVRTVMAPMDKRFLPYILGRGVPPPNNNTLRWCTRQIKIDPMAAELRRLRDEADLGKILVLTGVRLGESAVRDQRIALSCAGNGAECGQGWYQETLPDALCNTLAPLLHWRVCHVWEWLKHWAPEAQFGDWTTELLAEAYGGDEAEENHARTGCVGCPLATKDTALDSLLRRPAWAYLAPLKELRSIYREMRSPLVRLRKAGRELRKDGTAASNPQRMGPLTLEARRGFFQRILDLQDRINQAADQQGRPRVDILNHEELKFIEACLIAGLYPDKWDGSEPLATELLPLVHADGTEQPLLWGLK